MTLLEMKDITKIFPGNVIANEDVTLTVERGEVHALLGENGAGKSTLMNILYGLYQQTSGKIYYKNKEVIVESPRHAINIGIGMVHQHFMLIPALTVIENVILGLNDNQFVLDIDLAAKKFIEISQKYNMPIDPYAKVWQLSVGEQQRLEILKALYREADLLILDEPTAVLTPQEVDELFEIIRQFVKEGHTVIFISHKLSEVMKICDRCTVLRRGKLEKTLRISEVADQHELAKLMVGTEVDLQIKKEFIEPKGTVLQVEKLVANGSNQQEAIHGISFDVKAGEILGVCGVDGNGQSELIECITGLRHVVEGSVLISGDDCTNLGTKKILSQKVSHIPEDRHKRGMVANMTVEENIIMMTYNTAPISNKGVINWNNAAIFSNKICEKYNIKTPNIHESVGNLSGGNQQKIVVGRELDRKPNLLIAVHPDRGLDIGATKFIQNEILLERKRGAAVLLVSAELDEILELSDRIIVLYEGKIMGEMTGSEASREQLGLLMAGVTN